MAHHVAVVIIIIDQAALGAGHRMGTGGISRQFAGTVAAAAGTPVVHVPQVNQGVVDVARIGCGGGLL